MLQYTATVGTAKNGYVAGYRVAGKTGTSEKIDEWNAQGRKGEKRYIASYCGYAPADDPEIVMLVFFDEPLSQEGQVFGSAIAGPVFAEVMSQALPYLGVEPQYTEEELSKLDAKDSQRNRGYGENRKGKNHGPELKLQGIWRWGYGYFPDSRCGGYDTQGRDCHAVYG